MNYKRSTLNKANDSLTNKLIGDIKRNFINSEDNQRRFILVSKKHCKFDDIPLLYKEINFLLANTTEGAKGNYSEWLFRYITPKEHIHILKELPYAKRTPVFENENLDIALVYGTDGYELCNDFVANDKTLANFEDAISAVFNQIKESIVASEILNDYDIDSRNFRMSLFYYNCNFKSLVPYSTICIDGMNLKDAEDTPLSFIYNNTLDKLLERTKYLPGQLHVGDAYENKRLNVVVLSSDEHCDKYVEGWKRNIEVNLFGNNKSKAMEMKSYRINHNSADKLRNHKTPSQIHTAIPISCNALENNGCTNNDCNILDDCIKNIPSFVICFDILKVGKMIDSKDANTISDELNSILLKLHSDSSVLVKNLQNHIFCNKFVSKENRN